MNGSDEAPAPGPVPSPLLEGAVASELVVATEPVAAAVADRSLTCALCGAAVPAGEERRINQHLACARCAVDVVRELMATQATPATLPLATLAGLGGAAVGAIGWALLAITTNFEIGYVAVGVGYLAGLGVRLGARGKRGGLLPHVAVGCALFGLLLAKYLIFSHYLAAAVREDSGVEIGLFNLGALALFPTMLFKMVSLFDLLWVVLAVGAARRGPAASAVRLGS